MKKYFHIKSAEVPLYRGRLVLIISNDGDKIQKVIPEYDVDEEPYAHSWLSDYKGKQGFFIVLNFNNQHGVITHGTITHEAVHICGFIFDNRGIRHDFDNDEPFAYLSDWIVDQIYKFVNEKKFNVAINR